MTTLQRVVSGAAYNLLGKAGSMLFGFVTAFYLIRNYSVTDYGTYTLLMSLVSLATVTTSGGISSALERYAPEFYSLKDFTNLRKLFFCSVVVRFLLSGLFLVIIFKSNTVQQLLKFDVLMNFKIEIAFIILAIMQAQLIGDSFLSALLQQKFTNIAQLVYSAAEFAGIYASIKFSLGLTGLFITFAASNTILSLFLLTKSVSMLYSNSEVKTQPTAQFKRVLTYVFFAIFVVWGYAFVDIWIDNFVINYYLGKDAVAYYGFANMIANTLLTFSPATLFLPIITSISITKFSKTKSILDLSTTYNEYNRLITFFTLPAITGFILLSDKIIPLVFGSKYIPAIPVVNIILIFSFAKVYSFPLRVLIKTLEKVHLLLIAFLLSGYNIIMDIVLVQQYGVSGVVIATGTTGILSYLLMNTILSKEIKHKFPKKNLIKVCINVVVMSLMIITIKSYANNLISLLSIILIGIIVYAASSIWLKQFNSFERDLIAKIIRTEFLINPNPK